MASVPVRRQVSYSHQNVFPKMVAGQACVRARLLVVPPLRSKITASAAEDEVIRAGMTAPL
jgi:hypothetical protein